MGIDTGEDTWYLKGERVSTRLLMLPIIFLKHDGINCG